MIYSKMINFSSKQQLNILLPNQNRALQEVLKSIPDKELAALSKAKDLGTLLTSIFQKSTQSASMNESLLIMLKNNPTLKELANISSTISTLQNTLSKESKQQDQLQKLLTTLDSSLQDIDPKKLKNKIINSGVFLESKIAKASTANEIKAVFENDVKALILKLQEELTTAPTTQNRAELLKALDKLSLQIEYYQLLSHLSSGSSLYLPYSWDALEDGSLTLYTAKEDAYFCDIELTLKEYGALWLRLGLFYEKSLSINIQTQSKELEKLIKDNISTLKKQLVAAGITPQEIRFTPIQKSSVEYAYVSEDFNMGFEVKA